jgi:hypothetical protein
MAFRILYNAASDRGANVITSSSDGTSNTDDNAVDDRVGKVWRTDTDTTEWIKWDLVVTSKNVDCVALIGHNLTASATVTFEGHTADSWGAPTVNETLTIATDSDSNVLPNIVHYFTQDTLRWWRVTIDDPTNPDGYIQVGRIMFGEYYEVTRDLSADMRVERVDPSEGTKAPGEVPVLTQKARFRRIRTTFQFVAQAEADKWDAIFDYVGNSKPALISWEPTTRPTKSSAYVYMLTPLTLAHQFSGYFDAAAIVWEEKTR